MTIKELEIACEEARIVADKYREEVEARCKAENRMREVDDPWSGHRERVASYNAEENAQNCENNKKFFALARELDEAKKAERKAKAAARRAKKNAELGITEEQRKAMANAKRTATEIRQAQAEIAGLQIRIQKLEAKKAEYEKIAKGL